MKPQTDSCAVAAKPDTVITLGGSLFLTAVLLFCGLGVLRGYQAEKSTELLCQGGWSIAALSVQS